MSKDNKEELQKLWEERMAYERAYRARLRQSKTGELIWSTAKNTLPSDWLQIIGDVLIFNVSVATGVLTAPTVLGGAAIGAGVSVVVAALTNLYLNDQGEAGELLRRCIPNFLKSKDRELMDALSKLDKDQLASLVDLANKTK